MNDLDALNLGRVLIGFPKSAVDFLMISKDILNAKSSA